MLTLYVCGKKAPDIAYEMSEAAIQLQWAANNLQLTLNVLGPLNLSFAINGECCTIKKKKTKWIKCELVFVWKLHLKSIKHVNFGGTSVTNINCARDIGVTMNKFWVLRCAWKNKIGRALVWVCVCVNESSFTVHKIVSMALKSLCLPVEEWYGFGGNVNQVQHLAWNHHCLAYSASCTRKRN